MAWIISSKNVFYGPFRSAKSAFEWAIENVGKPDGFAWAKDRFEVIPLERPTSD